MAKRVLVILGEGFEEIEAVVIIDILRRCGLEVIVAGLGDLKVKASHGVVLVADKKLDDVGGDFDACVLPGGMPGASNLAASPKVLSLLKRMDKEKKIIAAICASVAVVLAATGILKNKSATCYPGMQQHFSKDTRYKEDDVVIDGPIITSRGPATAMLFALAIAQKLVSPETAEKVRKAILLT